MHVLPLAAALLTLAAPPPATDAPARTQRGIDLFLKLQFGDAVGELAEASRQLEEQLPTSGDFESFAKTTSFLAASYLGLHDESAAQSAFFRILTYRPDYVLPSDVFAPEAQQAFAKAKLSLASSQRPTERSARAPATAPVVVIEAPPASTSVPVGAYVLGGAGIAVAAAGAILWGVAGSQASRDQIETGPGGFPEHTLTYAQISSIDGQAVAGQVVLGVGVAALAGAVIWALVGPHASGARAVAE